MTKFNFRFGYKKMLILSFLLLPSLLLKAQSMITFNNDNAGKAYIAKVIRNPLLPANSTEESKVPIIGEFGYRLDIDHPQLIGIELDSTRSFRAYVIPDEHLRINITETGVNYVGSAKEINEYFDEKFKVLGYQSITEKNFMIDRNLSAQKGLNLINSYYVQDTTFLFEHKERLPAWFVDKEKELCILNTQTAKYLWATAKPIAYNDLLAQDTSLAHPLLRPLESSNLRERSYYNLLCYYYFKKAADQDNEPYITRYRKVLDAMLEDGLPAETMEYFNSYWLSFMVPYTGNLTDLNGYQLLWNELRPDFKELGHVDMIDKLMKAKIEELQGPNALKKDMMAPIITATDSNGNVVSTTELRGKWIYLDLWATWCTPCLQGMASKNEMNWDKYGKDLVLLNVCLQSKVDDWKSYLSKHSSKELHWYVDAQTTAKLMEQYQVFGLPHYVIINPDGKILENQTASPARITAVLDKLLTSY